MHPLNILFSLVVFAITIGTAYLLNLKYKFVGHSHRNSSIDGLRGFLAIAVFIHHSVIWYDYLHSGLWRVPASNYYTQLGQTGVSLFFMISSFLFVSKLMNAKSSDFNWKNFFIGRV